MGRPAGSFKFKDADELSNAIEKYFNDCDAKPALDEAGFQLTDRHGNPMFYPAKPYTMEGLALALGITTRTLVNYAQNEAFSDVVEWARERCIAYNAERLYDKEGSNGAKFYLINNAERMGGLRYAERQEMAVETAPITFVDDLRDELKELIESLSDDERAELIECDLTV